MLEARSRAAQNWVSKLASGVTAQTTIHQMKKTEQKEERKKVMKEKKEKAPNQTKQTNKTPTQTNQTKLN